MPVTYSIDTTRRLIRTACTRPLTFAQVIAHFRELNDDPACSQRLDVLLDVTDGDTLPNSSQLGAVGAAASAIRKKVQFGFCAVVADSDAMFGMMRVFAVQAGAYFDAIRVFRSAGEAEKWLNSNPAAIDPEPPSATHPSGI
ncbi:MAG TPA: hypothetical protein VIX37_04180 [Candidatus Sulfotelmatobacter sp.]